jgi:hypothetical protein
VDRDTDGTQCGHHLLAEVAVREKLRLHGGRELG